MFYCSSWPLGLFQYNVLVFNGEGMDIHYVSHRDLVSKC